MTNLAPLSGVLARIARVAGDEAARKVALVKGDREIKMPARVKNSNLSRIVGLAAAKAIVDEFGPACRVYIPGGEYHNGGGRRAKAAQLLQKGISPRAVALEVGLTIRAIHYIAKDISQGGDASQPKLPFDIT